MTKTLNQTEGPRARPDKGFGAWLWSRFTRVSGRNGQRKEEDLSYWRELVLRAIYLTGVVSSPLGFFLIVSFFAQRGQWLIVAAYVTAIAWGVVALLFYRHIWFSLRAVVTIAFFYFLGIAVLISLGPFSSGLVWLFTGAVVSGVILGLRVGLLTVVVNALTLIVLGIEIKAGNLDWAKTYQDPLQHWLILSINFIILNALASAAVAALAKGLVASLTKEKAIRGSLTSDIQRRQETERALQEQSELFRSLADFSPFAVGIIAEDGTVEYLNQAFTRMFGYTIEEVPDRIALREKLYSDPQYRAEVSAAIEVWESAGAKERREVERRMTAKDGRVLDVAFYGAYLPGGRYYTVLIDMTERLRYEQELSRSEERFRRLIETTPTAVFTVTPDLLIEFANPAALKLFQASGPGELIGRPYLDLVHPDDRAGSVERITRMLKEDFSQVPSRQHRYLTLKGEEIEAESLGAAFEYRGRKVFQAMVQDITERNRALAALRESEQRFRELAEMLPETIFEVDLSGRINYVNAAAHTSFGYSPEDLRQGLTALDMIVPEERARAAGMIKAKLEGYDFGGTEYQGLRKDGSVFPVIVHSTPIVKDGRVTGLRGLIIDISDLKKAEEEKERLKQHLHQAQKMEAVGTLAGGIAHDFNNILAAITGYTELTLDEASKLGLPAEPLNQVLKAADRAKELVKRILAFSRKMEPVLRPLDLNKEIIQAGRILERTIPKMIEIQYRLAEDLPPIRGDAVQVEQVLLNLGGNARDAMPQGGRLVIETSQAILDEESCRGRLDLRPGHFVVLTVSDTGHGMDEETLAKIFDPFFTRKETGQGTGLGLATAYGIVKTHGGHITCSSEPGKGATFRVYLPALAGEGGLESGEAEEAAETLSGEEAILLVDDEESLRHIGRQVLANHGYSVRTADSGEAALEIFGRRGVEIDLVILDVNMPGMGGHRCLQALLELDPEVKVIIASGYSRDGSLREVVESGAAGFIGKPFTTREMLRTVRRVLDGDTS